MNYGRTEKWVGACVHGHARGPPLKYGHSSFVCTPVLHRSSSSMEILFMLGWCVYQMCALIMSSYVGIALALVSVIVVGGAACLDAELAEARGELCVHDDCW